MINSGGHNLRYLFLYQLVTNLKPFKERLVIPE
jgi:hypothetical protein